MNCTCPTCRSYLEFPDLRPGELENLKEATSSTKGCLTFVGIVTMPLGIGIFILIALLFVGPVRDVTCPVCGKYFQVRAK
ncbi:hypothetical protein LLG10_00945 [bacterium]|nr:hypothetical protein [bacterium]